MQTYHTETTIAPNGLPVLTNLPFKAGEIVEVTIEAKNGGSPIIKREFPFRGHPLNYIDPFEPAVPPEDWNALRDTDDDTP